MKLLKRFTKVGWLLFLLVPLSYLGAQEDTETRQLGDFCKIKAYDGISINLIKSAENKLVIYGEDSDKVVVVNNDETLKLRMKIDKIFGGYKTFVDVYYNGELLLIDVNEDARISSKSSIEQDVLEIRAQEGGELDLICETEQLLAKSVTGGKIRIEGNTHNQDIIINTGGNFEGGNFKSLITTISVSAGGNAQIHATKYVKANVKAGGAVEVFGNPEKLDKKTLFGGSVKRVGGNP